MWKVTLWGDIFLSAMVWVHFFLQRHVMANSFQLEAFFFSIMAMSLYAHWIYGNAVNHKLLTKGGKINIHHLNLNKPPIPFPLDWRSGFSDATKWPGFCFSGFSSFPEWFKEDDTLFSCTDWPPQSPEFNSSEELCNVLGKALDSGLTHPPSIEDLGEKLMQLWTEIKLVILHKVVETIPWRILKAKGWPVNNFWRVGVGHGHCRINVLHRGCQT